MVKHHIKCWSFAFLHSYSIGEFLTLALQTARCEYITFMALLHILTKVVSHLLCHCHNFFQITSLFSKSTSHLQQKSNK